METLGPAGGMQAVAYGCSRQGRMCAALVVQREVRCKCGLEEAGGEETKQLAALN